MNVDRSKQTPFMRLPFWIRWSFVFWVLIGVFPMFSRILGIEFLSSPEWVSLVRIPATASGAIIAIFLTLLVVIGFRINDPGLGKLIKYGTILFMPFVGFVIGSGAVTMSGPMIGAAIVGTETEIPFTVTSFKPDIDRKCQNPITLDGLPFMYNRVCGSSKEFGRSLEVGGQILVTGKGTGIGIFIESAHRIE